MDLTAWVDVAIGLSVVYLGASLFVTVFNEYVSHLLNLRGKQLFNDLRTLFADPKLEAIPALIPSLKPLLHPKDGKLPSYVDPNLLGQLLVGGLAVYGTAADTVTNVKKGIEELPETQLKTQLKALVESVDTSGEQLVKAVSEWADRSLTMLGEGYKRSLQTKSFWIGIAIAVALNLDTVSLTEHLYRDKEARDAAAALGIQVAAGADKPTFEKCVALSSTELQKDKSCAAFSGLVDAIQRRNKSLGNLPIGWTTGRGDSVSAPQWIAELGWVRVWDVGTRLAGWVLTAFAIALGAPFWFDFLNKFVNLRHGMRRPEVDPAKAGGP